MATELLFISSSYNQYAGEATLPAKFERMVDKMNLEEKVKGKVTAIKMHVGRAIGYTTIHPLFVKTLVDKLKGYGAKVYITDQEVDGASDRGYREEFLGCPIVQVDGATEKYFYEHPVDFKNLKDCDVAGHIQDAEFLIDLSHIKGHGSCGFGGACKNLAMGCVTTRTRRQIHGLEGGIDWDESKCIHCDKCIDSCNHHANKFDENGKYVMDYHHCTVCQHCTKVCPTNSLTLDDGKFEDFQEGMAVATKTVLDTFEKGNVYYINFLVNITAICDCWGMSTPSLVPDIGVLAGDDIVAIEKASMDMIKVENLIPNGLPIGFKLGEGEHLFEQLHGRDPDVQLQKLEKYGLGSREYTIKETR